MIPSLYESAAFYGAPLSVRPVRHHELRLFVDLVLSEGESRLRNLLPYILARQSEGQQGLGRTFDQWASGDPAFRICWEFTQMALRQITEQDWSMEDRHRWRQSCEEANRIAIEPERSLANLRRFLRHLV